MFRINFSISVWKASEGGIVWLSPSAVKSFRIGWLFSTTVKSLRMWRNSGSSVKLVRLISQVGNLVFPAFGRNLRNGSNWCFKQTFQFLRKKRHKEFWIFCETCPPDPPSWELVVFPDLFPHNEQLKHATLTLAKNRQKLISEKWFFLFYGRSTISTENN